MRIPIQVRSLALILTMLVIATACKKSPTAPDDEPNELTSEGAVVQAMRGQPACQPRSTLTWQGALFTAIRRACLHPVIDATGDTIDVTVSNIGSSGLDGVLVDLPPPQLVDVAQSLGLTGVAGIHVRDVWRGPRGRSVTDTWVGPMFPGAWEFKVAAPRMGCRPARLEALRGGVVIEQARVSCETQGPSKGAYVLGTLAPTGDTQLRLDRGHPAPGVFRVEIEFLGGPVAVTLPTGQTVVIGGIRLSGAVGAVAALQRSSFTAASAVAGVTGLVNVDRMGIPGINTVAER